MSKSYDRNIERLKANQSEISAQERGITTAAANARGQYEIAHARDIANKLTPFSTALQKWKDEDIKKKIEEGRAELDKAKIENANWLEEHGSEHQKKIREQEKKIAEIKRAQKAGELEFEIEDVKAQDIELQKLKTEWLQRKGTSGYPDAERLAQLSPWQQYGYVQEDIKNKKAMIPDMLAHSMQNGEENLTFGGITYNAKAISGNKLAFQMKEHATHFYMDQIYKNLGLDNYSEEMLRRSKVGETVRNAKESEIAKHRKAYNIESSMRTQQKADITWNDSEQTGKDVEQFLLTYGATVNTKNQLLGNKGALDAFFRLLVEDGVKKNGENSLLRKIHDLPIPEDLRQRLNAKPGATFGSHWGKRFAAAEQSIIDGNTKQVDQLLENQELAGKQLTAAFNADKEAKYKEGRSLTSAEVNNWIDQYTAIGAKIPDIVKNYQTNSERSAEKDEKTIKNIIDRDGGITHQQLDSFHPLAAGRNRDKADAFEKKRYEEHGADDLIKGALNGTFADMGVKDREKSVAYQTAYHNAKRDYHKQFNEYISFGVSEETAHLWALTGPKDKQGQAFLNDDGQPYFEGRLGVQTEIETNGENSKYTRAGLHVEDTIGDEMKRIRFAMNVEKELSASKEPWNLRKTKILGGDYGQKQLDAIKANIKRYGFNRGMAMSTENIQFYKAIMAGRNQQQGGWWGLIHDQLMFDDPKGGGLQRNEVANSILPLYTRKVTAENGEEEPLEDPDGVTEVSSSALSAADNGAALYAYNTITDADNYYNNKSNGSIFDQPDQIPSYLGGTA